jgi:hypothetical protein
LARIVEECDQSCLAGGFTLFTGWHAIWASFGASTQIFVDGTRIVQAAAKPFAPSVQPIVVGPFLGEIDELYVWDFEL